MVLSLIAFSEILCGGLPLRGGSHGLRLEGGAQPRRAVVGSRRGGGGSLGGCELERHVIREAEEETPGGGGKTRGVWDNTGRGDRRSALKVMATIAIAMMVMRRRLSSCK